MRTMTADIGWLTNNGQHHCRSKHVSSIPQPLWFHGKMVGLLSLAHPQRLSTIANRYSAMVAKRKETLFAVIDSFVGQFIILQSIPFDHAVSLI